MLNSQGQSWQSENMMARNDKCNISARESDFIHFVGVFCLEKIHVKHNIGQMVTKQKLYFFKEKFCNVVKYLK